MAAQPRRASTATNGSSPTDSPDWRRCVEWLVRCGSIPKEHKVTTPLAQVQDLVHILKDGVILCNLLNKLRPHSIQVKEFSQRPQMSQFVSTLNIKVFLQYCKSVFGLVDSDLFEPNELFSCENFNKVIHTLSVLSKAAEAKFTPRISGFITVEKATAYNHQLDDYIDEDDDELDYEYYEDPYSVNQAEEEEIYGTLVSSHKTPTIPTAQEESQQGKSKRDLCIKELVDTERNYVEQALQMIQTFFMRPLKKLIPAEASNWNIIFMYIDELLSTHRKFLENLLKAAANDPRCPITIPDCFIMCKEEFLIYGEFCSNLTRSQETLDKILEDKANYDHVQKCQINANEGRFKLRDLLSVPMQRVLKYHLLLKELVRHTDPKHQERKSLEKALEEMQDLSLFINEVKRDNESLSAIDLLETSISSLEMPANMKLKDYGRMLLDGELKVKVDNKAHTARHVFLFDHVLLMCKAASSRSEEYVYKDGILLKQFVLDESQCRPSDKSSFSGTLTTSEGRQLVYVFTAKKVDARIKWIEAIRMAYDNIQPRFARTEQHDFIMSSFDKPTICDVCRKLLRGVFYQGYKCKRTNMAVHKECLERAKDMSGPPVLPPRPASQLSSRGSIALKGRVQAISAYNGDPPPANRRAVLRFDFGENIELINDDESSNWWEGEIAGRTGFFPRSCVKRMPHLSVRSPSYEPQISRSPSVRSMTLPPTPVSSHEDEGVFLRESTTLTRSQSNRYDTQPPQFMIGSARASMPTKLVAESREWGSLDDCEWFGGIMSRDEATSILQSPNVPNGTFIVRISVNDTRMGDFSLSIKHDDTVKHIRISKDAKTSELFLSKGKMFTDIQDLVQYYQNCSLEKIFPEVSTTLLLPYKEALAANAKKTRRPEPGVIGYCVALFDFSARSPNEISLKRGDRISIINKTGEARSWWKGRVGPNGKVGYFPNTYVQDDD